MPLKASTKAIFRFIFVSYNNTTEERTSEMGATQASHSLVY